MIRQTTVYNLECDRCGFELGYHDFDRLNTALAVARERGWTLTGEFDVCPGCSKDAQDQVKAGGPVATVARLVAEAQHATGIPGGSGE